MIISHCHVTNYHVQYHVILLALCTLQACKNVCCNPLYSCYSANARSTKRCSGVVDITFSSYPNYLSVSIIYNPLTIHCHLDMGSALKCKFEPYGLQEFSPHGSGWTFMSIPCTFDCRQRYDTNMLRHAQACHFQEWQRSRQWQRPVVYSKASRQI